MIVEVVITKRPTPLEAQNGGKDTMLVSPTCVVCDDIFAGIALVAAHNGEKIAKLGPLIRVQATQRYN